MSGITRTPISLDQEFAAHVGDQTRHASLVMSTDGGTGTPRGSHTMSYDRGGRAIPAEHRPKRIFDMLFVKSDNDAARRLALSRSALDDLMADARSLRQMLSTHDQHALDEYIESVRDAEIKVEKAKRWINMPFPTVDVDHLKLDITPEDPRVYLQTMFELIYLAFKTDSTRVATYQLGRGKRNRNQRLPGSRRRVQANPPTLAQHEGARRLEELRNLLSVHQRRIWTIR